MAHYTKLHFFASAPSGLWHPTFAHAATRKSFFFHRDHEYAGNRGFHRFRAAGQSINQQLYLSVSSSSLSSGLLIGDTI